MTDPSEALLVALEEADARELEDVDVIIGHGHITGGAARAIGRRHPQARLVHIVHTDPERVATSRRPSGRPPRSRRGQAKLRLEQTNCAQAHVVCGVGPKLAQVARMLLTRTVSTARQSEPDAVLELLPGVTGDEDVATGPGVGRQILTLGRLDDVSKGMDLFAQVVRDAGARLSNQQLEWVLRGIASERADREQVDAHS